MRVFTLQVCHENFAHNGTLASGESLSVSFWRALPTAADPVCHFWCTMDGGWPNVQEVALNQNLVDLLTSGGQHIQG